MSTDEKEQKKQFGTGPAAVVRRWLKEIELADKDEKEWRSCGESIWKRYRGDKRKRNSYNILWSNTETLAPALFNSPPSPDVRRRFRDDDPVGKVVSQLLERCLKFQTDNESFMHTVKNDVLDCILPGRGVSRVKYVPTMVPLTDAPAAGQAAPAAVAGAEYAQEAAETEKTVAEGGTPDDNEAVAWEQCEVEHVQWDDFRRGPGKTWDQVPWVAFKHRMCREELCELAGEAVANAIPVDDTADDTINKDAELKTVFGTVLVWEIWDKDERQVLYICPGYKQAPLKELPDPLKLVNFFPNPRPLYAIADSSTLVPTALFDQYREQADELDRVSNRINMLVEACRVRGIYDAMLKELEQLMRAGDKQLIPIQDATLWSERGGIEKAIMWMPIEQIARVLAQLYQARESAKQTIYELTGIADVRRGSTDPNETLGAQELKADFGNQRNSGLRLEVERYVRDLMLLMAEIVADKFSPDTLLRMSQMQIPTEEQINAKAQQMIAQAMEQAQAQGQQITPQQAMQQLPERPVSLEQVMAVLKDDASRMFKVDVETDSMVAATIVKDMAGLQQVLGGISQFISAIGPAVQLGAFPVEAVKEIVLTIARRAKLGTAVEDSLDKIKEPQPQQKENGAAEAQAKAQAEVQKAQISAQVTERTAQIKAESDARVAAMEARFQQETDIVRQRAEAAQHQAKLDNEAQLAALKQSFDERDAQRQREFEAWRAELQSATEVKKAQINAASKGVLQIDPATEAATKEIATEVRQ